MSPARWGRTPDDLAAVCLSLGGEEIAILSFRVDVAADIRLTTAERDVVEAILTGASNAQIARLRGVSVRTVANQVASAFRKLGVSSRAELAASIAFVESSLWSH